MAFVAPLSGASSFLGAPAAPAVSRAPAAPLAARAPAARAAPRMAFTSIDDPASAVTQFDDALQTEADVLVAAYRQVFGNAYVMESERAELAKVESEFCDGQLSVQNLVRAMAKSTQYRKRFFDRCGSYAFVELCHKHLLGRAPNSQAEVSFHVQKLMTDGYDADIDSYIDSDEYRENFGADTVPRFVYRGTYSPNDAFNRMNVVRQHWDGCSTSTVSGSTAPTKPIAAKLTMTPGAHCGNPSAIMRGIRADHDPKPAVPRVPSTPLNARAPLRVRIKVADNHYQVFETPAYVDPVEPAWKKELAGAKKWNGVWF